MDKRTFWFWWVFPAAAMSLAWGLRGYIGGGSLGAMIPGAMIGLSLCLLLGRDKSAGFVALCAAIGVGFGGQETYGQTVGLSLQPATYWWALVGFAVKGAAWGLLGGAFIGIGLMRDRFRRRDLWIALALMVAGTWLGWKLVDQPKLIYFSNRLDRPREELWAGLCLGGIVLLVWLRSKIPTVFALWGAVGGGVGFALGAAAQVWGRGWMPHPWVDWWKVMEFTFGALLGLAYGACAHRQRAEIGEDRASEGPRRPLLVPLALSVFVLLAVRFDFTIVGAAVIAVALLSEELCRQTAITATFCAFALDLLRNQKTFPVAAMWVFVIVTTAAVAVYTFRRWSTRGMFLLMTWTAVAMSALKSSLQPARLGAQIPVEIVFVALAVAITLFANWVKRPADIARHISVGA